MTRFLAILLLLALVWFAIEIGVRRFLRSPTGRQIGAIYRAFSSLSTVQRRGADRGAAHTAGRAAPNTTTPAGHLVRCGVCGTHVPEDRALQAAGPNGGILCCTDDCRRMAEGQGSRNESA